MNNLDEIAKLLIFLGTDLAAEILKKLDPATQKKLIGALSQQTYIDEHDLIKTAERFHDYLVNAASPQSPSNLSRFNLEKCLNMAFKGDAASKYAQLVKDNKYLSDSIFNDYDENQIFQVIKNDMPASIAVILVLAPKELAAKIIVKFDKHQRTAILLAMSQIDSVNYDQIESLFEALKESLDKSAGSKHSSKNVDGIKKVSQILNYMSSESSQSILEEIRSRNETIHDKIVQDRIAITDLQYIPLKQRISFVAQYPITKWVACLKLSKNEDISSVLECFSSKNREELEELLQNAKIPLKEAKESQANILADLIFKIENNEIEFTKFEKYVS